MDNIFNLIETNTLTEDALIDFLADGLDINELEHEEKYSVLGAACNSGNINTVKMLLEYGATPYPDSYIEAYSSNNIPMLFLLLKKELQMTLRSAKKGDERAQKNIQNSNILYGSNTEESTKDQLKSITSNILNDSQLSAHVTIKKLLTTITLREYGAVFLGGNADDKIECAIIDLGENLGTLEYYLQTNWSYGQEHVYLAWKTSENSEEIIFNLDEDKLETVEVSELANLQKLATALTLETVPLQDLLKFLILLLSYMTQNARIFKEWNKHPFFGYLANEVVTNKELLELPIEKLSCEQHALDV